MIQAPGFKSLPEEALCLFIYKFGHKKDRGPGANVIYLSGAPLKRRLLALPANIRLRWKSLPRTNTLAYYNNVNYGKKFYKRVLAQLSQINGKMFLANLAPSFVRVK